MLFLISSLRFDFFNPALELNIDIDSKIFVFPEPFFPQIKIIFF